MWALIMKSINKDHIIDYYPNIKATCYLAAQSLVQVPLAHRENHSFSGGAAHMFLSVCCLKIG